jgi:hypothetical protein
MIVVGENTARNEKEIEPTRLSRRALRQAAGRSVTGLRGEHSSVLVSVGGRKDSNGEGENDGDLNRRNEGEIVAIVDIGQVSSSLVAS